MNGRPWIRSFALSALTAVVVFGLTSCSQLGAPTPQHQTPSQVRTQSVTPERELQSVTQFTRGVFAPWILDTSVAVDGGGVPHLAYAYGSNGLVGQVSYASPADTGWTGEPLDTPTYCRTFRCVSLAFHNSGTHHLTCGVRSGTRFTLAYATRTVSEDGPECDVEYPEATTVPDLSALVVSAPSLALDSKDHPHIAHVSSTDGGPVTADLRYAWNDGMFWHWNTVTEDAIDGESLGAWGWQSFSSSLALDNKGNPRIAFSGDGTLRYAWYDGEAWQITSAYTSTADDSDQLTTVSLALDSKDDPRIAFLDYGKLEYAFSNDDGENLRTENIATGTSDANYASLVLDRDGNPHISFIGSDCVQYAWHDGTNWIVETIASDIEGGIGGHSSLAFDSNDASTYISYYDYDCDANPQVGYLKLATISPSPPINDLITAVNDLTTSGTLKTGQAKGLIQPLDNALISLSKGNTDDAYNQLQDFISRVQTKTPKPRQTDTANDLITAAEDIETSLGY